MMLQNYDKKNATDMQKSYIAMIIKAQALR